MKKLLAALAAVSCLSIAQAAIIPIDDFSSNQGPLTDATPSTAATVAPDAVCDTTAIRTLCTSLINSVPAPDPFDTNDIRVSGGALRVNNGASHDTQATLRWNIAAGLVPVNALGTFNFLVVRSDGNPTDLQFYFNGTLIKADSIAANTINQTVSFAAPIAALAAGGVLELRINGNTGWDLTADNFGLDVTNLTVPVPAIPLLLGAGLVALGLRRKQK